MIDRVEPTVRLELVKIRLAALKRGADCASRMIQGLRQRAQLSGFDSVATGLLESEINYLDGRTSAALEIYTRYVDPALTEIDPRIATIIADNKSIVLREALGTSSRDDLYHLIDQRRMLGVELRNYAAVLEADAEAARGHHFMSLPIYWQQLRTAYRLQNWRSRALAERDLAYECVRLGFVADAVYHAVMSMDKEAMIAAKEALLDLRLCSQVPAALEKVLPASSLKKHAAQVALMLSRVADAVPDGSLPGVLRWLKNWAAFVPADPTETPLFQYVWEAIASLAARIEKKPAAYFSGHAMSHANVMERMGRQFPIRALYKLCGNLGMDQLSSLRNLAVDLVLAKRSDLDYVDCVNLLCRVAKLGGDEFRTAIRSQLFPQGAEIKDLILLQAAPHLGWTPREPEQFSESARRVADAVRRQVQRLGIDEQPAKIGGYGTISQRTPSGHTMVHISGALHLIGSLVPYRHQIDETSLSDLISAILDMIDESENIIANRAELASTLVQFMDRLPYDMVRRVRDVLEPLADGSITESSIGQSHAQAVDPLNPFKMGTGDPITLRGEALRCLANLERTRPEVGGLFHKQLLLSALTGESPEMRQYALLAAFERGHLTEIERTAVGLAGLDSDSRVAQLALRALSAGIGTLRLNKAIWHMMVRCIEVAVRSNDARHRSSAAGLVRELSVRKIPRELGGRFGAACAALKADYCYSVRKRMQSPDAELHGSP